MDNVKFKGIECDLLGHFPKVGDKAPAFELTSDSLGAIKSEDYKGRKLVLNIFPSLDTGVCAASVRRFNKEAGNLTDTTVLCVSMDLPFAMGRFCVAEGINNVVTASAFRDHEFAKDYGVMIVAGPLRGLLARAVVVIDKDGKVAYTQLVDEITNEPDYEKALEVLNKQ